MPVGEAANCGIRLPEEVFSFLQGDAGFGVIMERRIWNSYIWSLRTRRAGLIVQIPYLRLVQGYAGFGVIMEFAHLVFADKTGGLIVQIPYPTYDSYNFKIFAPAKYLL